MAFNLTAMAERSGKRRDTVLREIAPPAVLAADLFRSCYLPAIELCIAGCAPIMAEYERTLGEMTTDSPAGIQIENDRLGEALRALILNLAPAVRDWVLRVETWHRQKWRGAVLAAAGVDLSTLIGPEGVATTIEARIAANVALIRDVGAQAQGRIAGAVFRGLTERKPARAVAADLREAVAMGRRRSINIASDQLSKISSELADERRREAGLDVWMWNHSQKKHPRIEHKARDGKLFSEVRARQGTTVEGKVVNAPPPADDWPGRPPFCGCTSRSILVFE